MDLAKKGQLLAHKLIAKYGYASAIYVENKENPSNWKNPLTPIEHEIKICIVPLDKYSRESLRINGSLDMAESNYMGFLPTYNFQPKLNDFIKTGQITYTIVSVIEINPNGTKVIYKLELK